MSTHSRLRRGLYVGTDCFKVTDAAWLRYLHKHQNIQRYSVSRFMKTLLALHHLLTDHRVVENLLDHGEVRSSAMMAIAVHGATVRLQLLFFYSMFSSPCAHRCSHDVISPSHRLSFISSRRHFLPLW